jgi:stage IV sporulation protein FB
MGGSIKLFSVRGIDVKMHVTFLLIVLYGAIQGGVLGNGGVTGAVFGAALMLLVFACVLLHELGHALTALRYGVRTRDIILLPIGGIARLERIPDKPSEEFTIAIAGPLVNFAIAGVLFVLTFALLRVPLALDLESIVSALRRARVEDAILALASINLTLGAFNLVPAFPLDGGRILRAILATRMEYVRATTLAANIGQLLAIVGGFLGFLRSDFGLILVAIFVFMGAGAEGQMVAVRSALRGVRVRDVFSRRGASLAPTDPLSRAVEITLSSFQNDFPILEGEQLVGILSHSELVAALSQGNAHVPVSAVMRRDWRAVGLDEPLFDIQQQMGADGNNVLAVLDGGRFVGLLTPADISEAYRLLSVNPGLLAARRATQQTAERERTTMNRMN